jgi:hypothetical protein
MSGHLESVENRFPLPVGHCLTLAVWQLAQPTDPKTVFDLIAKTDSGKSLDMRRFEQICSSLIEAGYLWKAHGGTYIVTPSGAVAANIAMAPAVRDKQRLFYLNRVRHFEVDA